MGIFLVNCGKRQIHLALEASNSLNADDSGSALPVVVRIYQLKGKDRIERADFVSLWKADREVLGDDILELKEMTIFPGSKVALEVEPLKDSQYLAVVALFRRPDETAWRETIFLKGSKIKHVEITLHERGIKVERAK